MRDAEEIHEFLISLIDNMYQGPERYVGPLNVPGKAHMLIGMFWQAHFVWADLVEKRQQFDSVVNQVWNELDYGDHSLVDGYRRTHPFAQEEEVVRHTLAVWHKVSRRLGIAVRELPAT